MARKLIVKRKGYTRKAHARKPFTMRRKGKRIRVKASHVKTTRVGPTTFKIRDIGRKGRGRRVLPKLKKGTLGGKGFFSKPTKERRRIERNLAKRIGEKKVSGKLRAIQVFSMRTNPSVAAKAKADARYIHGAFVGTRFVGKGKGFRQKRR